MATHDRSGPNRWLHGSIAAAVVGQAGVPVLLVRATKGMRPIERLCEARPELIVPLDGSSLAEQGGAIGTCTGAGHARLESEAREYRETTLTTLKASGLSAEATARQGKPAAEIGEVAREHGAAALVMATHGRTGLIRALLGSVAGEVLHLGTSPVVLVRPPELRRAEQPILDTATSAALAPGRKLADRPCGET